VPYCPRCGVEVDTGRKKCPLCSVTIPVTGKDDDTSYDNIQSLQFPVPENVYTGKMIDIKKNTFYGLTSFFILHLIFLFTWHLYNHSLGRPTLYITAVILSVWLYLYIFFGFIRNKKVMITSLIINTFFFTFLLDVFNGLYWYLPIFVPATILGSVILIITAVVFRFTKKRSVNLILPVSLAISLFLIGLECIISLKRAGKIVVSWSLLLAGEIIFLALLLLFFYHKIPARLFKALKKKLHI
jgi:hypothetical protein